MTQLVSARFVLEMAIEFANICAMYNGHRKAGTPPSQWRHAILRDYRAATSRMGVNGPAFTSLQVVELHAVIEGFRGAFSRHTEERLVRIVHSAHGLNSFYADAVGRVLGGFGLEFVLEVVPKLCWMSLQSHDPGRTFTNALLSLGVRDTSALVGMSAHELCATSGADASSYARSLRLRTPALRAHSLYPLWEEYFDAIERETDPERFLQLVMHPSKASAKGSKIRRWELMPPLTIYRDNGYSMNGPHRDKGWVAAEPLIRISHALTATLDALEVEASHE